MRESTKRRLLTRRCIRNAIKEYVGTDFYFLEQHLDGGYDEYVRSNVEKLTHVKRFGRTKLKKEFTHINSLELREGILLDQCESAVGYVKECLNREGLLK